MKTNMGDACAKSIGLEQAFTEPKDCADALVKLVGYILVPDDNMVIVSC